MADHPIRSFPLRVRAADIYLIVFLLALSVLGLRYARHIRKPGSFFLIELNGETVYRLSLHADTLFEISGSTGPVSICVRDGKVCVSSTTCPYKICKKTGWIGTPGESIICVPNRMAITIEGGTRGNIDAITE